jgi:hypothetical protein
MDDVRLDEMGSGGDKLLCLIVTLRCDASFCFHRIVSAVNIHSMLARFACSRASPVNSYGCRPLFFFGVMLWLCSGYALVMLWLCSGYALVMLWLCSGYALVMLWLGRSPVGLSNVVGRRWGADPP